MTARPDYARLPTEADNPRSRNIDRVPIRKALQIINNEDRLVANAVQKEIPSIEKAVKLITASLKRGGRLFFFGAGTSGRLGVMEAAECPPTFNTPRNLVQAFMAGGRLSVFRSKEGAEDQGQDGARLAQKHVRSGDVAIGIAASGVTPYVREALTRARRRGAETILVTCHSGKFQNPAKQTIAVAVGPEVIAGSTRLKAATATKMVLNMMTVAAMVQLGKVYGNKMVDLQPKSAKLRARGTRLISVLGNVSEKEAARLFTAARGRAKTAIVMARKKISAAKAARLLKEGEGRMHEALKRQ